MSSTMQSVGLLDALERVPRCSLGTYPTPLVRLENLSRELGRAVYVKRDDALGPASGSVPGARNMGVVPRVTLAADISVQTQ